MPPQLGSLPQGDGLRLTGMPPARVENSPPPQAEAAYWDSVVRGASSALNCTLWRLFCDRLHERLIQKWVGRQRFGLALKTDLFDEAQGQGLVEVLGALSREVYGMDIAADIVQNAARKNPGLKASVGDVRKLDFPDDAFDFICSDSTLDHFATLGELRQSIAELVRVLQPGGRLLITLDNPVNPLVALRNRLPQGRMGALGLVPYFMGRTLSMGLPTRCS